MTSRRGGGLGASAMLVLAVGVPTPLEAQPSAVAANGPEAILGAWETAREDDGQWSRVEIHRCSDDPDRFCGTIVWLSHPLVTEEESIEQAGVPKLDVNNPNERLRDRPILGLPLMHSFRYDDGVWKDGRIYDPRSGKTYRCQLRLENDGQLLKVRGFIKIAFVKVGRTTDWTRFVGDGAPS